jgi:hypothetical protein
MNVPSAVNPSSGQLEVPDHGETHQQLGEKVQEVHADWLNGTINLGE